MFINWSRPGTQNFFLNFRKKEKEEKEEQRKLAWAQTLQERELKKKQKEEEKLKVSYEPKIITWIKLWFFI